MKILRHEDVVDIVESVLDRWDKQAGNDPKATSRARAWYLHDALLANGMRIVGDSDTEIVAEYLSQTGMDKGNAVLAIDAVINSMSDANYTRSGWLNEFVDKCKQQSIWFHRMGK